MKKLTFKAICLITGSLLFTTNTSVCHGLAGGGTIVALIGAAAVVGGIVVVADNDNDNYCLDNAVNRPTPHKNTAVSEKNNALNALKAINDTPNISCEAAKEKATAARTAATNARTAATTARTVAKVTESEGRP